MTALISEPPDRKIGDAALAVAPPTIRGQKKAFSVFLAGSEALKQPAFTLLAQNQRSQSLPWQLV
jgi:hypothetical protein